MTIKKILLYLFIAFSVPLSAQVEDTTIYKIVSEMPRFPGCEQLDTTIEVKNQCAQASLLMFFNRNIAYPMVAREEEIMGTVVMSFVVEKDGFISNPKIVKDIGGGCGDEALRVANGMNEALKAVKFAWSPGKKDGKAVRTQMTVPIKFQLKDPPDFVIVGYDTVFVVLDDSLAFKKGDLSAFVQSKLQTPYGYEDSCKIGTMDLTIRVDPEGFVKVLDVSDYYNLGPDFQFEAISAAGKSFREWVPARRMDKAVPASTDLTITFLPKAAKCKQQIADYEKANALANEGSDLFNEGKQEEGIVKLTEALAFFPDNANFLYLRGQAYMNMKKMDEACADFIKVRSIVYIDMVNQLIPLICK